jgi:fructan beta-fructosidase
MSISCSKKSQKKEMKLDNRESELVETSYKEHFRPQFHFSPQEKWMNDPNGLVYHKGVYHLFYQYYPEDIVWGPMHWGHAISKDLISWIHKPIALFPDELGYIFSGSAVVDIKNTSGFGTKENPPLVAIFTYHLMEGEQAGRNDFQTQGIAYSLNNGDSWTKYKENPVIGNDGIKDFRDPKVFWHEDSNQWIMVLVANDHAKFYSSDDLKEWVYLSDFGRDKGAHGGVWECPDLFKLKVAGSDEEKWILIISINPGAPNGGSGTQYFIGDFDGNTFTVEHKDEKWIDYGTDNYAGVTYNNTPNDERIFIGWMSNWNYARDTPTKKWRSAMTLPRELSLHKENSSYFLKNFPIPSFNNQSEQIEATSEIHLGAIVRDSINLNQTDISFNVSLDENLEVQMKNSKNEYVRFYVDTTSSELILDRTQSGIVDFEKSFGASKHKQPYISKKELVEIRIITDQSSIEIFVDKGRYVFTEQIFPSENYSTLLIAPEHGGHIEDFKLNSIKTIW